MNIRKTIAVLLVSYLTCGNAVTQVPGIKGAQVTIPYEELKRLLDDAGDTGSQAEPESPPVEAVLSSARYQLDLSAPEPFLSADYEARTFTATWHAIPLCGSSARLTGSDATEPASVVLSKDHYTLLNDGEGILGAKLTLAVPPPSKWKREEGFGFLPAPATVNELTVTGIPENRTLEVEGIAPSRVAGGSYRFHLPGDGREVRLFLRESTDETGLPAVPSLWTLHSQILARYNDGRLRYTARIQAQAETGSGLSLSLVLPPKAARITVESEDLDRFRLMPREDDGRRIAIEWKTRDTLDRTLMVSWETPQSPLAETWVLTPPTADAPDDQPAEGQSRALIALVPIDGLELTHPDLRAAVESRQLPEWLREQLGDDESLTAEITGAAPLDLSATWLPRLETAQATVSLASFESRLVADGSILVTANYEIQHGSPIDWSLDLPSADQILTCEVNQQPARPIRRDDSTIEFRLPPPTDYATGEGNEKLVGSRVQLCYSLKLDPLDPVSGRVAIELPQTGLFIHRLDWSLAIPDRYEPTAIEGNVELADRNSHSKDAEASNLIRLSKELCRDERPSVEIFYQRKDLASGS